MGRRQRGRGVTEAVAGEPGAVVKVGTFGAEPGATRVLPEGEQNRAFTQAGALVPPYNPQTLAWMYEHSHALRPNVEAYSTNIEGFPWRLEATVDLDAKDLDEQIRRCVQIEKVFDRLNRPGAELSEEDRRRALVVTDDEVEARKVEIESAIVVEKLQAQMFFEGLSVGEISFTELRKRTRTDLEVTGNAYWEAVRDSYGRICQLNYAASAFMRLMPVQDRFTEVWQEQKISPISYRRVKRWRRFRRFVQLRDGAELIYFKEFGDIRVMGARTGRFYDSEEHGQETEGSRWLTATEVIHHKIHSPLSAYGVPRWVGAWPAVMGGRAAEEVNESFFDNKAIPPMAILVSGGVLAKGAVGRIKRYLRDNIRGRKNFWSVMVLEAEGQPLGAGQAPPRIRIEIKPLMKDVPQDAMFLEYSKRADELVGIQFRNPRLVRGEMGDFNRACYSEDTETLTEQGWKRWFEIGHNERIAAFAPDTGCMSFELPTEKHVYHVEAEEMIRFKNAHTDVLVTAEHKMLVRSAQTRAKVIPWLAHEAQAIPFNLFDLRVAPDAWVAGREELVGFDLPKDPLCKIERGHCHRDVIAGDDWLEFLGYWLSEGGLLTTEHPAAPYLVYVDQKDPENAAKMKCCLDRLGWKYSTQQKPCGTTHFLLSNRCLRTWLITHAGTHAHDKRIPGGYLDLPERQLRIIYDALMLGDGSYDSRPNRTACCYYSQSSVLAGQVQRLALQLGMRASVRPGMRCLRVMICERRTTRLNACGGPRAKAGVTRQLYTGTVYCFSVPSHGFFVTRRNGKVAIQGNTADVAMRFVEQQVFAPLRTDVDHGINSKLMAELRIRFWSFKSGSPIAKDPKEQAEMIKALGDYFTPKEARQLIGPLFGTELGEDDSDWTRQPLAVSLMRLQAGMPMLEEEESVGEESAGSVDVMQALKAFIVAARKQSAEQASAEERRLLEAEAGPAEPETITVQVPAADFGDPEKLGKHVVDALGGADAAA